MVRLSLMDSDWIRLSTWETEQQVSFNRIVQYVRLVTSFAKLNQINDDRDGAGRVQRWTTTSD